MTRPGHDLEFLAVSCILVRRSAVSGHPSVYGADENLNAGNHAPELRE